MAAVDALVTQWHIRCPHFTGDHGDRVLILGQVVRPALSIGHDERGRVGAAAGPARSLHVVRRGRRHVAQHHRLQFADVHAQLERGRAGQGVDLAADEALLDVRGFDTGQLASVLAGAQRDGVERPVQVPVVVVVLAQRRGRRTSPGFRRSRWSCRHPGPTPRPGGGIAGSGTSRRRGRPERAAARCGPPGGRRRAVRRGSWPASRPAGFPRTASSHAARRVGLLGCLRL